ncbi:MAG: phosphopyruvate hydratase [Nitrososphaerota archaeon]|jgi:enolase|nr:phosphopyruvate hydratase [Nitrososphaerota archaeon]MDG6955735.1 phosphopyruvate hydratase [Nitrososphaerota archaeon]MDG6958764.1 phosphopyruvate hydratase [Nitrososphaerota archaeon]MDG6960032.1 phosphopyruvate hydratase [Nitrososphaerota archaeon]MDG6965439.1 phosphopyruvate hydratase [Nitrososphaerota archaeon]
MAVKTNILDVRARQVLDSRGNPTVEAEVESGRAMGRASVPSGASKGRHEALELRDGGERFHGMGVAKAVGNVRGALRRGVVGLRVDDQRRLDHKMISLDGTPDKSKLGANAILAVSMASAKAAANSNGVSLFVQLRKSGRYILPVPMMNVINGGEHAGNDLAVQEFLIEPVGASSCAEAIRMGSEVYHSLKAILVSEHGRGAINVGDEGGFAPPFRLTREALGSIRKAVSASGYSEKEVKLGIDAAASTFYDEKSGRYTLDGHAMSGEALEDHYARLRDEFGLLTIEDPFHEEAFDDFASITKRLGRSTKVIGDDIYVTNVARIKLGIEKKATNAVLIKLNQIGTVSETEDAIGLARAAGWTPVVSHRSGETEDPFIAHLATAFGADFIKTGAPARGERVAKYNELLRIEEELRSKAGYAGRELG